MVNHASVLYLKYLDVFFSYKALRVNNIVNSKKIFLMPAARVRVPGGSPFSQLHGREKDNSHL